MRLSITTAALLALAACGTSIPQDAPDAGSGAGFSEYDAYQARRDAELAGRALPAPDAVSSMPLDATSEGGGQGAGQSGGGDAYDIAAQTRAALGTDGSVQSSDMGEPMIQPAEGYSTPVPQTANSAGISVENSFDAVSGSRSIEDDAALVAAQRSQYEVAEVKALPSRSGGEGPNIVAYALASTHAPGTKMYRRMGLNSQAKSERNCAAYPGPDMAQIDFLTKGGPERDRMSLDPDGDGYACGWDPRPFRKAEGN